MPVNTKLSEISTYRRSCKVRILHHKICVEHFSRINNFLSIAVISLVSMTGISNNITSLTGEESNTTLNVLYSVVLYFTAVLTGIQKFYNYAEKIESHKTAYTRFSNLLDTINDYINNIYNTEEFYKLIIEEYKDVKQSAPYIPLWVSKTQLDVDDIDDINITSTQHQQPETQPLFTPESSNIQKTDKSSIESIERRLELEMKRFQLNTFRAVS